MTPCPFCHSDDQRTIKGSLCYVHCNTCGADGPPGVDKDEAEMLWNERIEKR